MGEIELRMASAEEYSGSAKDIWRACFPEDDGPFCDYYFKYRTKPEYLLGAYDNGRMVGTVHMIPQRIMLMDCVLDIGFVAGVATLSEYRHRGIAAAMMQRAHTIMRERGLCAAMLQPFDVGFYERFGYRVFAKRRVYTSGRGEEPSCPLHIPDAEELFRLYTRFAAGYNGMAVRSMESCRTLLLEKQGGASFISNGGAYAMYYEGGDEAAVMELCGSPEAMRSLAAAIWAQGGAKIPVPEDIRLDGEYTDIPFNMLCPLDMDSLNEGLTVRIDDIARGEYGVNYSFESY